MIMQCPDDVRMLQKSYLVRQGIHHGRHFFA